MLVTGGACQETGHVPELTSGWVRLSSPRQRHRLFTGADGLRCTLFMLPENWIASAIPNGNLFVSDARIEMLLAGERGDERDPGAAIRRDLNIRQALAHLAAAVHDKHLDDMPAWIEDAYFALGERNGSHRVDAIAGSAKVTREHLSRTFAKYFGCSPAEYRSARRLICAIELLRGSDVPIADIAHAAGFSDQSHLTRALSEKSGLSPARVRQQRTNAGAPSRSSSDNIPGR